MPSSFPTIAPLMSSYFLPSFSSIPTSSPHSISHPSHPSLSNPQHTVSFPSPATPLSYSTHKLALGLHRTRSPRAAKVSSNPPLRPNPLYSLPGRTGKKNLRMSLAIRAGARTPSIPFSRRDPHSATFLLPCLAALAAKSGQDSTARDVGRADRTEHTSQGGLSA